MRHSLFAVICFAVATAFAQPGMEDDADLEATETTEEVAAPTEETAEAAPAEAAPAEETAEASPEKDEFSEFDDVPSASADSTEEEETAAVASAEEEEECDEEEEECGEEEEAEDDTEDVDVAGEVDNTEADERDYAAYDAEGGVDRFGIADEVRFWSAIGLAAVSVGSIVMGVLQHMKANEAKAAYDDLADVEETLLGAVSTACGGDAACEVAMIQKADLGDGYTIADLQKRKDTNKDTQDSYALWRNVWFGVAGVTLTAGIVLYVW